MVSDVVAGQRPPPFLVSDFAPFSGACPAPTGRADLRMRPALPLSGRISAASKRCGHGRGQAGKRPTWVPFGDAPGVPAADPATVYMSFAVIEACPHWPPSFSEPLTGCCCEPKARPWHIPMTTSAFCWGLLAGALGPSVGVAVPDLSSVRPRFVLLCGVAVGPARPGGSS